MPPGCPPTCADPWPVAGNALSRTRVARQTAAASRSDFSYLTGHSRGTGKTGWRNILPMPRRSCSHSRRKTSWMRGSGACRHDKHTPHPQGLSNARPAPSRMVLHRPSLRGCTDAHPAVDVSDHGPDAGSIVLDHNRGKFARHVLGLLRYADRHLARNLLVDLRDLPIRISHHGRLAGVGLLSDAHGQR